MGRAGGVRRPDYRAVRPTPEEVAAYHAGHKARLGHSSPHLAPAVPMAEHLPCGTRHWYSGIGIGAHMRACPGTRQDAQGS